jgi:hypothetical protein
MMTTLNFLSKFALLSAALFIFSESGVAQDKSERLSPPKSVEQTVNGGLVVIDYSSPAQNDRVIWGNLVPYDKVWRTGANEATTISFEKDVTIDGKTIKAGKYALFSTPGPKSWTFMINEVWDQWGSYKYDPSRNVAEFPGVAKEREDSQERMEFTISPDGLVTLSWADLDVSFDID